MPYTTVYQVLNDINLHTKVLAGSPFSLGDIQAIAQSRWTWIVDNWSTLSERFKTLTGGNQNLINKYDMLKTFVNSYKLGNKANPFDIIDNFVNVIAILNFVSLGELTLTVDETIYKDTEIDRLSKLHTDDFKSMIKFLRTTQAVLAQEVGLGDADAAKLLGIKMIPPKRAATVKDLEDIQQIADLQVFAEKYLFRMRQQTQRPPNVLQLSNQAIDPNSKIVFDTGFITYVPRVFEISLEHMAQKYMGNRDLWFELVTINNLQPPYIDESGKKFPLLAPGAVNSVIISDTNKENVPVGTKVGIGSFKYKEEARIVERTIVGENGSIVLFLSGAQNINKFKPSEGAFVRIYAPHTVKKGDYIQIPSKSPSDIDTSVSTPSSDELRRLDKALLQFGVDIARDKKTNDWVFDTNGNFKKAAGLLNVEQSVLRAVKRNKGELPFHPNLGIDINIGGRFFGTTDEAAIFSQILVDSLLADPRYASVNVGKLQTTGTGIALTLLVKISGSSQLIPLNFIS